MLTKEQERFYYLSAINSAIRQCISTTLYARDKGIDLSPEQMLELLNSVIESEHHTPLADLKREVGAAIRENITELRKAEDRNPSELFDSFQSCVDTIEEPDPRVFFVDATQEQKFQVIGFITTIAYKIEKIKQLIGFNNAKHPDFEQFIPLVMDAVMPQTNKVLRQRGFLGEEEIVQSAKEYVNITAVISYFLKNFIEAWNSSEEFKLTYEFLKTYKVYGEATLPDQVVEAVYGSSWEQSDMKEEEE